MTVPVRWLLDTNFVSEMMRPQPESRVADFLDTILTEGTGLSSVTVWKILNSIDLLDQGKRREDIARQFQNLLDDVFEERILEWTEAMPRSAPALWKQSVAEENPLTVICQTQ